MDERGAVRIGGQVTNPGGTERLHEYWVHGEGAAKIRWGEGGDYDRCVTHLSKYVRDAHGLCANLHHAALGIWPATHAAMEHKAGRSQVSEPYDGDGLDASWDGDHSDLPDLTGLDVSHLEAAAGDAAAGYGAEHAAARAAKLGSGARFKKLKASLAAKGARDPGALAAHIGRKKYGKAKFMSLAAKARGGTKRSDAPPARGEYMRLYQLEDIHILRSADGGDGRTVEAYAAVFGQEAEIKDHEGHYIEVIEPTAFSRAIDHAQRARGGFPGSVKVLYNHGMTLNGSPSERFSMPIGVPVDIRAEARGLLTRTRYSETPLADEVLENIRSGAITSQSFTGRIMRSDPQLRAGDRHRRRSGQLTTVRRTELGLREYGPVLWPAYSGAEILGVRMSTPGGALDPDELDDAEQALPPDGEPAPGDPPTPDGDEHSARYHQHALYTLRSKELREKAGLVW